MGFLERLAQHASHQGQHAAVVTNTFALNYDDLFHCVNRSILALQAAGFTSSDIIGVNLDDEVEHLIVSLALMGTCAGQITLASHDTSRLHTTIAERVSVTKVISAAESSKIFDRAWLSPGACAGYRHVATAQSVTVYFRTSGTTGDINIVPLAEEQIIDQARRNVEYASERLLRLASIEHNNSKRHRLYCVWAGGTNVFRPKGSFDLINFVLEHNVTCLDISRMHASNIATLQGADKLAKVKLRTGGSAIPYAVRKKIEENVTRNLHVRYAATECGSISVAGPGEHDEGETVGKALDGVDLEIVDDRGNRMAVGESGELRLRAAGVATCYLDSRADNAKRFRDGWFYPGDVGCIREDGRLIIQGRSDDMIVLNGLNIFPVEIERVLEGHPDVGCAAAFGLPSQVHGHIPVAAVEMKKNTITSITSPAELRRFSRAALGLKAPRRILILDSLPRNSQGKVVKRAILPLFKSKALARDAHWLLITQPNARRSQE
jgi:long-chain acyl-CoA synthetase